jgi:thioredoxin-like negative regulator of GroEL
LGPILEELAAANEGKAVKVIKANVDGAGNWPLAQSFQVSSIPAVFMIKNWEVVKPIVGVNPQDVYQKEIDALLADG